MKHICVITFCLALLLAVPISIAASSSHNHEQGHISSKAGDAHDGVSIDGGMAIVGSMSSKGVKGMAHIKDVSEVMSHLGMQTTHHFMIAFANEETGEQIKSGTVALKLTNPDAKVSDPIELVEMDGHFGADIVMDMEGEYHFRLGTKLEDGTKRKYHFHFVNK